jgi:hypothetical protein
LLAYATTERVRSHDVILSLSDVILSLSDVILSLSDVILSLSDVILSLSKDGPATHGYLTPILRQAQDDIEACQQSRSMIVTLPG